MKLLVFTLLLACSAYGFSFSNNHYEPEEIAPANVCASQPNGSRFPVAGDCNRFILCDNEVGLTLTCRSTEPHFNRCESRCVNDIAVCTITSCPGEPTPPPDVPTPSPDVPTDVPTVPTPPPTVPPVTPAPTTTTTFDIPTVPVIIPCDPLPDGSEDDPCGLPPTDPLTKCDCDEQWGCLRGRCECDTSIQCPFEDLNGACIRNCGCQANCDCPSGGTFDCVCFDTCRCIGPPDLCPFAPAQCVARCGCMQRCDCFGNLCTCDPGTRC